MIGGMGLAGISTSSALGDLSEKKDDASWVPPSNLSVQASNRAADLIQGSQKGEFEFETERIQGAINLNGDYHGVTRLIDKKTSQQVIDSRYSALNLFRLFSVNQGMGQPRYMDRSTSSSSGGAEAHWPATKAHLGEITARYEILRENAVDLAVTVHSAGNYPGYEILLSSYFEKRMRPHVYLQPERGSKDNKPDLVVPYVNDVFRGTLLVFPRDTHAARRCVDGRWDRSEWDAPVVQACPVRRYAHCLAFMFDPETKLAAVLMAHQDHCYAISTRYHADAAADRMTSYSAFDMSLFGNDFIPGEIRTVRVRLALAHLEEPMLKPLELYQQFLSDLEQVPANS